MFVKSCAQLCIGIALFVGQYITIEAIEPSDSLGGFHRPIVTITYDDAWVSQYEEAFPLLKKYKMFATFYILTGSLGKPGYMTTDQILDLYKAGHEIGAHTVTHPDLSTIPAYQVQQELKNSQDFLENLIKHPVPDFAAPYGSVSYDAVKLIKQFYKTNRSVTFGFNTKNTFDPFKIKALAISASTSFAAVKQFLENTSKHHVWAVLVYHRIGGEANQTNISVAEFETHLQEIQKQNLTILTLQQALQELLPQITNTNADF